MFADIGSRLRFLFAEAGDFFILRLEDGEHG